MSDTAPSASRNLWIALLLAVILAGASFILQARQGFNVTDEGFLWYGVQQTAAGAVPLRDFQSYEPGRYYWSAATSLLFGKGLIALRFSETLFQIAGLTFGLLAVTRLSRDWKVLLVAGLMLTLWMFPPHKLFDHTLLIVGVWMAMRLIEKTSHKRVALAGAFVGLCVFFGKNHACYNLLAQGAILLLLWLKDRPKVSLWHLLSWLGGIAVGLTPMLAMFLFIPGFFSSYLESLQAVFQHGTNLGLQIPWLWRTSYIGGVVRISQSVILGFCLSALPIAYFAAIVICLSTKVQRIRAHALLTACAFVGLAYLNHIFSRADLSHLAQGIHPFTLGLLALAPLFYARRSYLFVMGTVLVIAGFLGVGTQTPAYLRLTSPVPWKPVDAGGPIFVPAATAEGFDCLRQFVAQRFAASDGVLVIPYSPGLYPIMQRPSPLWSLVFYFPDDTGQQKAMIDRLGKRNVNWVVVTDMTMDEREDLRFSATHPLVWRYLDQNYEQVNVPCLMGFARMLHSKAPASAAHEPNEARAAPN